jgi:amidohydrolase
MNQQALATRKNEIMRALEALRPELVHMSDFIFDHPEVGFQEVQAAQLLSGYLQDQGFQLEMGYGGLPTAFRATHQNGSGGPRIGLLCEYDAITNLGHACAHHLQGPAIAGAAVALKASLRDFPYTLEVIGTPAEEIGGGGKNAMLEHGAFKDLDVALMMHGGDATQTDIRSMAITEFLVTFHGLSAHSAIAPDAGRSALEALMLVFSGIAYLRGHVRDDTRMHGIIVNGGQAVNAIPERATARIELRSYDRPYLDQLIGRVMRIIEGAALMTDTRSEVEKVVDIHNKIPVITLNDLLMANAGLAGATGIMPPREKTGSTDFASVMYFVPGSCIRVPFVEPGAKAHSQAYLDRGKTGEAHGALVLGAKIVALTALDLITDQAALDTLRQEFHRKKAEGAKL